MDLSQPSPSTCRPDCLQCPSRGMCFLPADGGRLPPPASVPISRRRLAAGDAAHGADPDGTNLYVVRMGALKAVMPLAHGREQVTGFALPGDLIGADALAQGRRESRAVALEHAQVCVFPYEAVAHAASTDKELCARFWRAIGGDIVRSQSAAAVLGTGSAQARVAAFLLEMAHRMKERGYSAQEFHLRMGREEIGSYLGLTLETVSRALHQFAREGALEVHKRHVRLLDTEQLALNSQAAVA
jgi:CRP/FNR family transcriptional regulator, anaerobic regulatory protein